MLEDNDLVNKSHPKKTRATYAELQQETSRTDLGMPPHDTMIINDLEYASTPLNVEKTLKDNSPARRKHKKF